MTFGHTSQHWPNYKTFVQMERAKQLFFSGFIENYRLLQIGYQEILRKTSEITTSLNIGETRDNQDGTGGE